MRLIYLHGPPASGKLTIARELESTIGARNVHNHLTLDVARALFPFGTEDFWRLVRRLREVVLEAAARMPDAVVVQTACYSHPDDEASFRSYCAILERAGGRMLPVFLRCAVEELERRVTHPDRAAMGKLRTVEGLRESLERWSYRPVPHPACITVDTGRAGAEACAAEIVRRFSLDADPSDPEQEE